MFDEAMFASVLKLLQMFHDLLSSSLVAGWLSSVQINFLGFNDVACVEMIA